MKENQLARGIVANLAWRYRIARRLAEKSEEYPDEIRELYLETEREAWNAYVCSRDILFREEDANVL